jgi:hypothetical protein
LHDTRLARRDDRYKEYNERKNEGYTKLIAEKLSPFVNKPVDESKPLIGAVGTYKD